MKNKNIKLQPKYPIYVPSYSRFKQCQTARFLIKDNVFFYLVVQPQEYELYLKEFPNANYLILPEDIKNLIQTRNWIKEHSINNGNKRHWQIDDNIYCIKRLFKGKRIYCNSNIALAVTEDFVDRYTNVAIAGLNYEMFVLNHANKPYNKNVHVYSCSLILNKIPYKWRLTYNDDTDICLQVLANGWCTILMNIFMIKKIQTMIVKGGNTNQLYEGDGRLKMSRMLEQAWPIVSKTDRRYKRPAHIIHSNWRKFDTELIRRKDIDWNKIKDNKYDMKLVKVKEIQNESLNQFYEKESNQT